MGRQWRTNRLRHALAQSHGLRSESERRSTKKRRVAPFGELGDSLGIGQGAGEWLVDKRCQANLERRGCQATMRARIARQDQYAIYVFERIGEGRAYALDQTSIRDLLGEAWVGVIAGHHAHVTFDGSLATGRENTPDVLGAIRP